MIRFYLLLLTIFGSFAQEEGGNSLNNPEFWNYINDACINFGEILKGTVKVKDIESLRVIEYTNDTHYVHNLRSNVADTLMKSHLNPHWKTVIFVHGFVDDPKHFSGYTFGSAYRHYGEYNILALDSSDIIGKFFLKSAVAVKFVGTALGRIVDDLVKLGLKVDKIHIVGHSLGAHIAGFAGKAFQRLQNGLKISRITGLDPAGPCFKSVPPRQRLDKDDAHFVDVIHTSNLLGMVAAIGHVDFYPNGGVIQPGCSDPICSHERVWSLFEESINKYNAFWGLQCDSWTAFNTGNCLHNRRVIMGHAANETTRGTYYLNTTSTSPFSLGQ